MIFSLAFVFVGDIRTIAEITSLGALITFFAVNSSLIWLRITKPKAKRPFRVPLNLGNYPILPILGMLSSAFLIMQFENKLMSLSIAALIVGVGVFEAKRRKLI